MKFRSTFAGSQATKRKRQQDNEKEKEGERETGSERVQLSKTNDDLLNFNLVLQQICHKYLSAPSKSYVHCKL